MALGGQEERAQSPQTHESVCSKRLEITALVKQLSQAMFHNKVLLNLLLFTPGKGLLLVWPFLYHLRNI